MHIGHNRVWGGHGIYKFNGTNWDPFPGAGNRITVDNKGQPWVTRDWDEVWRWMNNKWHRLPGRAKDIGSGSKGTVVAIG